MKKAFEPTAFEGTPPAVMAAVEKLLGLVLDPPQIDDAYDTIHDVLDAWRHARGEAGMQPWRWRVKGSDDEGFNGEWPTRDEAVAAIPDMIRRGDINCSDGKVTVAEARHWADTFEIDGREIVYFAEMRNEAALDARIDVLKGGVA